MHISNYLSLHQFQMGHMVQSWVKFGPKLGQIRPKLAKLAKKPKLDRSTYFDCRDFPFGSRHRFDCYDHPQGMSEVTLIPYRHPDGQFGQYDSATVQCGPNILALSELF